MKKENLSYSGTTSAIRGADPAILLTEIARDTRKGLSAKPKYLLSKYLYDQQGDGIFREIMNMPEYYLTDCELEILSDNLEHISAALTDNNSFFRLIELGPGDGLKTKILLHSLIDRSTDFIFIPVDISSDANRKLSSSLRYEMGNLTVKPETGDYLKVVRNLDHSSRSGKVILFLGSNIGNLEEKELHIFLNDLSESTKSGDRLLIGFDLKKSARIIMNAYDDPYGLTRKFNLNHLERLNRELQADFKIDKFEHHTDYDPVTGMLRSYLLSTEEQTVLIEALDQIFEFGEWEPVFMELSRKFDLEQIEELASRYRFRVERNFMDSRKYFADSLWIRE
jgi:dimethylhistidine N-methyltransferase